MNTVSRRRGSLAGAFTLCTLATAALAGCGGGGGSSSQATPSSGSVPSSSPPPTITGTPPAQVTAGSAYSFTPTASGPAGTTLSFSIQNMPPWAGFSIATGALTGTPTTSNVGTYANIVISVSDGSKSAALTPFSINVAAPPTSGSASLTWTAPTTNTDGSALTDLAGFTINYGNSPNAMTQTISVQTASATNYTVQGLAAGTWYFTVTAYTSIGTQSAPSNMASKTIS